MEGSLSGEEGFVLCLSLGCRNTALSLESHSPRVLLTIHRSHWWLKAWATLLPEKSRELHLFLFLFENSKVGPEVFVKYGGKSNESGSLMAVMVTKATPWPPVGIPSLFM